MSVPRHTGPSGLDDPHLSRPDLTLADEDGAPVIGSAPRRRGRGDESAAIGDVWSVLDRARTDEAPRTLAAAQDAIFQRYLPMARTLAHRVDTDDRPVDPVAAEKAAELGLAQAVLGWRRPDSAGLELFASIAMAAQLDRLPTVQPPRSAGSPGAD